MIRVMGLKLRISLMLFFCFFGLESMSQNITNVDANPNGNCIIISFEMDKPSDVNISYSINDGFFQDIPNKYIKKLPVQDTKYKYMWDVVEQFGEFIFSDVIFKIDLIGYVPHPFSVSMDCQVYFSPGNLQYNISSNIWRFSDNQYEILEKAASDSKSWIDLFGWGTSGWDSGAKAFQPNSTSGNNRDYHPGGYIAAFKLNYDGSSSQNPNSSAGRNLVGKYANADWGVYNSQRISSKYGEQRAWRTLTKNEWQYLLEGRKNSSSLHQNSYIENVYGLILYPDDWDINANFKKSHYSLDEWCIMEGKGAIFLPFKTGHYYGSREYWSSTSAGVDDAFGLSFNHIYGIARSRASLVRLVSNVKEEIQIQDISFYEVKKEQGKENVSVVKHKTFNVPKTEDFYGVTLGYLIPNENFYIDAGGVQIGIKYEPIFKGGFGLNLGANMSLWAGADTTFGLSLNLPLYGEFHANFSKSFSLFAFGGIGLSYIDYTVPQYDTTLNKNDTKEGSFGFMTYDFGGGIRCKNMQVRYTTSIYKNDFIQQMISLDFFLPNSEISSSTYGSNTQTYNTRSRSGTPSYYRHNYSGHPSVPTKSIHEK